MTKSEFWTYCSKYMPAPLELHYVIQAYQYAKNGHANQHRDGGAPY